LTFHALKALKPTVESLNQISYQGLEVTSSSPTASDTTVAVLKPVIESLNLIDNRLDASEASNLSPKPRFLCTYKANRVAVTDLLASVAMLVLSMKPKL